MYRLKYMLFEGIFFLSFFREGGRGKGGVNVQKEIRASMNGKHCQLRWAGHS